MPKSIVIDPKEVRKAQVIKIGDIPLNQYVPDFKKELKIFGKKGLVKMYHDMVVIREFESMLNSIKTQGAYEGIEYNHRGPAHLSIGQESTAVGECAPLSREDFIFGSHRSHGEILAKCLSAADKLGEPELMEVMKGYLGGDVLSVVERGKQADAADLAEDFILYGTLAEIFARKPGFNRGMGGSMHAFFAPFGSMPNNAIVGGSADISVGRRALQADQPEAGDRHREYRRRLARLWSGLGGDDALGDGPVPHSLAEGGRGCPADPVQLHQQLLRHGRPDLRRDDGLHRISPASGQASTRRTCTPSASTATIPSP